MLEELLISVRAFNNRPSELVNNTMLEHFTSAVHQILSRARVSLMMRSGSGEVTLRVSDHEPIPPHMGWP
jgi:hypothetical protein